MRVSRIVNEYRSSNTFIVELNETEVILVDVGGPQITELLQWLKDHNKNVRAAFLTHEHADHCIGVNELYNFKPFLLYCSKACAGNIRNSRQNFSFYTEEIPTFEITTPVTVLPHESKIEIDGLSIKAIETPGHSPGSMCFSIGNGFFSGDTLLNNVKTPLTFPHSNRQHYKQSLQKIESTLALGTQVYPGHGLPFEYTKLEIETLVK